MQHGATCSGCGIQWEQEQTWSSLWPSWDTVTTNDADPASAQIPNTSHSNEISPLSPPRANNDPPPFFILGDCLKKI